MTDPEKFLERWSRLKRVSAPGSSRKPRSESRKSAQDDRSEQANSRPGTQAKTASAAKQSSRAAQAAEDAPPTAPFDPASLPSIESITASTDIRAFLQSGVPAELTRAALRRVWTADPAIRDFIGIAENQWDFTDPSAMPGFGPLEATDDVRKLVAQAMGELGKTAETDPEQSNGRPAETIQDEATAFSAQAHVSAQASTQVSGIPAGICDNQDAGLSVEPQSNTAYDASQHVDARAEADKKLSRRTHGRALPQ